MKSTKFNFTKAALDSLTAENGAGETSDRRTFWDAKVDGLQIRVAGSGTKTFCVYKWFKHGGKPERVTIGRYPDWSIEQARVKARQVLAALASGQNPNAIARQRRAEMTFAELFEIYIERHARLRNRTWHEDIAKFKRYLSRDGIGSNVGKLQLSALDRPRISALHSKIGKTHPTTANRVLALVRSVFARAANWGLFEGVNPATGIETFQERSRDRYLAPSELPRFFNALKNEPNPVARDFLYMCLLTGARRGNVLAMRWEHIDLAQSIWRISESESKNKSPMVVSLTPEATSLLQQRKVDSSSPYVFPGSGRLGHFHEPKRAWDRLLDWDELAQLTEQLRQTGHAIEFAQSENLQERLRKARKLANVEKLDTTGCRLLDLRVHDLRRTMGSYQAMTGASLIVIGKSLGHKSQASTHVYARLNLDPVRESMQKATTAMLEAGGLLPQSVRQVRQKR